MAKVIRATLFFTSGKYGWSETFFKSADDVDTVKLAAGTLALARIKLCGTGVQLPYIRVSDDAVKRDSLVDQINLIAAAKGKDRAALDTGGESVPSSLPIKVAIPDPADQPYSAILLRMESGSLYHRSMYLRGCPDSIIVNPAGPVKQKDWNDAFLAWAKELSKWSFQVFDRSDTTNPTKPIGGVVSSPPVVLTVNAHGFLNGQRVAVDGMIGKNVPHSVYTVDAVDANTIRLRGTILAVQYDRGGTVRLRKNTLATISDVIIRGETTRKTGRPFDSPSGRRRKAV